MLNFQIISNVLPIKNYTQLLNEIKKLGKDFDFVAETRAGRLKRDDYTLLKEAGFTIIQTGVESLSQSYLKKMNKGTRVIDNIAALKFCKENGIKNAYNFVVNYPNEESSDFQQTKQTIERIKQYIDPPSICNLKVVYGSPIFNHPEKFNIKKLTSVAIDRIMFPEKILEKCFSFVYDYETLKNPPKNNWNELIENWENERKRFLNVGFKTQMDSDRFVFYFVDGGTFIKIFDKRNFDTIQIYVLNQIEREVFLLCTNVISFEELENNLSDTSGEELKDILDSFEQAKIIYSEDNFYLSLPLNYRKLIGIKKENPIFSKSVSVLA